MMHDATTNILESAKQDPSWLGAPIKGTSISVFIDFALLLVLGGMPWQVSHIICLMRMNYL